MITRFRTFVDQQLKKSGISQSDLIAKIGYRNTNKGLRRFDSLLDHRIPPNNAFLKALSDALGIDDDHSNKEFQASLSESTATSKSCFKPHIFIEIKEKIFPLVARGHLSKYQRVFANPELRHMPRLTEFDAVVSMYRDRATDDVLSLLR